MIGNGLIIWTKKIPDQNFSLSILSTDYQSKNMYRIMNIDIYLTKTEKDSYYELMNKHHVSLSTIADILVTETYYCALHYGKLKPLKEMLTILEGEYLYKEDRIFWKHGTIRPKCFNKKTENTFYREGIKNKQRYTTNVLHIYIKKDIKSYLTEEGVKIYYERINKQLQTRKEEQWNYNNVLRNMTRAIRNNWKYYERIIKEEKTKHEH